jgi:hypothetical protein
MPNSANVVSTAVVLSRPDTLSAIALLPFLSFMSRRPAVTRGDAAEFALIVLLEFRMLMSVTGFLPLTTFETSTGGVAAFVGVLVALNIAIFAFPSLRERF